MRFMLLLKASKASEAGEMPSETLLAEMGRFNQELIDSGALLDAAGLHPSAHGVVAQEKEFRSARAKRGT
jgi:hypothetical protein